MNSFLNLPASLLPVAVLVLAAHHPSAGSELLAAGAPTASMAGVVRVAANNRPVANATITLRITLNNRTTSYTAQSDAQGMFSIDSFPCNANNWSLGASAPGFRSSDQKLLPLQCVDSRSNTFQQDVYLVPGPTHLSNPVNGMKGSADPGGGLAFDFRDSQIRIRVTPDPGGSRRRSLDIQGRTAR